MEPSEQLLTTPEAAEVLRISARYLANLRPGGPPFLQAKAGSRVLYRREDLLNYLKRKPKRAAPASDAGWEAFADNYPRKEAMADAHKAWRQTASVRPALEAVLAALWRWVPYWKARGRQYTPLAASWLRAHRWNDPAPPAEAPLSRYEAALARENAALAGPAGDDGDDIYTTWKSLDDEARERQNGGV